jgi:hypothetical protein
MSSNSAGSGSYGVYGFNHGTGYGVYGKAYNSSGTGTYGINNSSGKYGYLGGQYYGVYGHNNDGGYGYIGGDNFSVYGYLDPDEIGNFAIYGSGVNNSGIVGSGYGMINTLGGVRGYNYWGNAYTFATAGYSYLDYARSGGNIGSNNGGTIWGVLAYKNSSSTIYGGYFTSYTNGTGKDDMASVNVGMGAWGDLFGADIHGKVYGAFIEGENYATYTHGNSFHKGLDIHLQENGSNKNTVLYTSVSTDATIQTSGFATISDGNASISFNQAFTEAVSETEPIIVTVTPMGNSNGFYLTGVSPDGFVVAENNQGKSNVTVSYIAIGKRKGLENPQLPEEVVAADYTAKLAQGLHNDNDTQTDGAGLYYENGQLVVGKHSSAFPDPNKQAKNTIAEPKPELRTDNNTNDGKAPQPEEK